MNFDYQGVSRTAFDALTCKLSADLCYGSVYHGFQEKKNDIKKTLSISDYYQNYASVVVKKQNPLLNRFYFFRQQCFHHLFQLSLVSMLQSNPSNVQIFIFGGGLDISFEFYEALHPQSHFHIYVVDLPEIIERRKLYHAKRNSCSSRTIHYIAGDLLQFSSVIDNLKGIDSSFPSIILFECVLSYLPVLNVAEINNYFSNFSRAVILEFDPLLDSSSGTTSGDMNYMQQMTSSFTSRNAQLQACFPTTQDYEQFYYQHGWKHATSLTLFDILHLFDLISDIEPLLIKSIESFDEYSSLHLLLQSYQISVGCSSSDLFLSLYNLLVPRTKMSNSNNNQKRIENIAARIDAIENKLASIERFMKSTLLTVEKGSTRYVNCC